MLINSNGLLSDIIFPQNLCSIRYNWLPSWHSLHSCLPAFFLSLWLPFSSTPSPLGLSNLWGIGSLKGFCCYSCLRSCATVKRAPAPLVTTSTLKLLGFSLTKNNFKNHITFKIFHLPLKSFLHFHIFWTKKSTVCPLTVWYFFPFPLILLFTENASFLSLHF